MTFRTVSHDDLERIAFESGAPIEAGAHCDHLILDGAYYCARREDVGLALAANVAAAHAELDAAGWPR